MISLPKKNQAMKRRHHRTISLISNTGKTAARILSERLESKTEEVIEDQFGFRISKGPRDTIGLMRIVTEKVLDVKEGMCLCFVDWRKSFDRVDSTELLEMLINIGVNWRERRLIRNLYMRKRVKLRLNQRKPIVLRLEEESDRDVAFHPNYLKYMEII